MSTIVMAVCLVMLAGAAAGVLYRLVKGPSLLDRVLSSDVLLSVVVAAIALHNIPEGIAVAVPVFQATGSRARAIGLSFLSGLSEPLGAVIGVLVRFMFDRYKVSAIYTGREPPPRIATPALIELVPA